ncbi:hypothetical protein EAF00_007548 [Botryotinia globosa]|nr:hypothetical protein EAF00_007548 [Botryotinia globosa]
MLSSDKLLKPWLRKKSARDIFKKIIFEFFNDLIYQETYEPSMQKEITVVISSNDEEVSPYLGHLDVMEIMELLLETYREGWMINRPGVLNSLELFKSTFIIKHDKIKCTGMRSGATITGLGSISDLKMIGESITVAVTKIHQHEYTGTASEHMNAQNKQTSVDPSPATLQQHRVGEKRPSDKSYGGPFSSNQKFCSRSHSPEQNEPRKRGNTSGGFRPVYHDFNRRENTVSNRQSELIYFDLGEYKQWVKDPTSFYDVSVQREILQEARAVLEDSGFECLSQMPSYNNLLERKGWRQSGHAELQEFHRMWPPACLDESKPFLHPRETKYHFWMILRKVQQFRHSDAQHTVNIPIVIIRQMLGDSISLTKMLGDRQAWKTLDRILQEFEIEVRWNFRAPSLIQFRRNKLRRIAKKYERNESENGDLAKKRIRESEFLAQELNREARSKDNKYRDCETIDRQCRDYEYSSIECLQRGRKRERER